MNITLCSSSSELIYPYVEGLRSNDSKLLVPKPSVRVHDGNKKDTVPVSNHDAGKEVMSCSNLISGLKGSFKEKNLLVEHGKKLEFIRTLLIDNYDSYTYNIYQELSVINGLPPVVVRNDEWAWEDVYRYLYEERAFDNIVISPGPGSPTCPADIGICLQLLLECWDIPILGVCLGHQHKVSRKFSNSGDGRPPEHPQTILCFEEKFWTMNNMLYWPLPANGYHCYFWAFFNCERSLALVGAMGYHGANTLEHAFRVNDFVGKHYVTIEINTFTVLCWQSSWSEYEISFFLKIFKHII